MSERSAPSQREQSLPLDPSQGRSSGTGCPTLNWEGRAIPLREKMILTEDHSLPSRLTSREQHALAELVQTNSDRILILIYRIISGYGSIQDAEELAADVYFKAWQDIGQFDPSRGSFDSWVRMLAKYTALNFRRKQLRQMTIMRRFLEKVASDCQEERQARTSATSFDAFEKAALLQELEEGVRQLPEDRQELIALRFGEGKTYAEIAKLTGKPVGSVKSALHRALNCLRQKMSEDYSLKHPD